MANHEVITVNLDGDEKISTPPKQKVSTNFPGKISKISVAPLEQRLRGWDGFDPIAVIKGNGIGNKTAFFMMIGICLVIFFAPVKADATSVVFNNQDVNFVMKIFVGLIFAVTMWGTFFLKKRIVITKTGFRCQVLWREFFVTWSGCSEFYIEERTVRKGIISNDVVERYVSFKHPEKPPLMGLSLPNVSVEVLCKRMNEYRELLAEAD